MMNCKELLEIVNPPIWKFYPEIVWSNNRLCRSFNSLKISHDMRILAINMIVDGEY